MLETIIKIINWIHSIWSSLPNETKEKIINKIVEESSEIFSKYYNHNKQSKDGAL